jgi:hypothetical protein
MKSAQIEVGKRYRFWLTNKEEVFTLTVDAILKNSQVRFIMRWDNPQAKQEPVFFTVDRSHILGKA